jgi:hypothetical protein
MPRPVLELLRAKHDQSWYLRTAAGDFTACKLHWNTPAKIMLRVLRKHAECEYAKAPDLLHRLRFVHLPGLHDVPVQYRAKKEHTR